MATSSPTVTPGVSPSQSTNPHDAQPQDASNATTSSSPSGGSVLFSTSGNANPTVPPRTHRAPRGRSLSLSRSLSTLSSWTLDATSALLPSPSAGIFGIACSFETVGGKEYWVIKVSKLGRWVVALHLLVLINGLLSFATTVYSWISNKQDDDMMQKILQAAKLSGPRLAGIDEKITKWMNDNKALSAAEEARVRTEQLRWNALLNVFKDCGASTDNVNGTTSCDELRRYFDTNSLPRPDKSAVAKRNLAELDRIIRQQHPDLPSVNLAPGHGYLWQALMSILTALMILCLGAITAYACYLAIRKLEVIIRRRSRSQDKKGQDEKNTILEGEEVDKAVPVFATGGDIGPDPPGFRFRGHRINDLHSVAGRGAWQELQRILQRDPHLDINAVDTANEYGSVLTAAARSGDMNTVDVVLRHKPILDVEAGRYHNALQAAAHSGQNAVVEMLLEKGMSETSVGGFYGTALNAAAEKGNSQMLNTLLRSDQVFQGFTQAGGTYGYPLIAAAARGDVDSVTTLLSLGASATQEDPSGTTALHRAAANGHQDVVQVLVNRSAALDSLSSTFGTALHAACRGRHMGVARLLLDHGADPSVKDSGKKTVLHETAGARPQDGLHDILVTVVEARPGLVNEKDTNGNTPLHLASISGNTAAVKVLLEYGANCDIGDNFNAQPLFRAAGCDHPDIVWLLLDQGKADPDAADVFGRTALHGPAQTTNVDVQKYLIEFGADVNAVGNDMKTPLHEACNMGRIKNVELLLERSDVKVNELDNDSFPPLYKALCSSDANERYLNNCVDEDIPRLLIERDDLDVNVAKGIAIQEAAKKGYTDMVESMLVKRGANVRAQGAKYGSVLQAAAISGNLDLINLLLRPEHHVDVNLTGGEFGSALAASAAYGHVHIVRRLLEAGADPCLFGVGRYGSPLQSVCRKLNPKANTKDRYDRSIRIEELLKAYGGEEAARKVGSPQEGLRWNNMTSGWGWQAPGEM